MKVFLSWSGDKSKAVAALLKAWLPTVLQAIDEPWMSNLDIAGGANWSATIGEELSTTDFGIICVSQENQGRPWLNFEAGAISKLVGGAVPFLVDFASQADLIGGPMSQLQVRMSDRDGTEMIVNDINRLLPRPLGTSVLAKIFDRSFPEFEAEFAAIIAHPKYDTVLPPRKEEDKIDELLTIARQLYQILPGALNSGIAGQANSGSTASGALTFSGGASGPNAPSKDVVQAFRSDVAKTQREVLGEVSRGGTMKTSWNQGKPTILVSGGMSDQELASFTKRLIARTGMDLTIRRDSNAEVGATDS